jgi:hypothetical protein
MSVSARDFLDMRKNWVDVRELLENCKTLRSFKTHPENRGWGTLRVFLICDAQWASCADTSRKLQDSTAWLRRGTAEELLIAQGDHGVYADGLTRGDVAGG